MGDLLLWKIGIQDADLSHINYSKFELKSEKKNCIWLFDIFLHTYAINKNDNQIQIWRKLIDIPKHIENLPVIDSQGICWSDKTKSCDQHLYNNHWNRYQNVRPVSRWRYIISKTKHIINSLISGNYRQLRVR